MDQNRPSSTLCNSIATISLCTSRAYTYMFACCRLRITSAIDEKSVMFSASSSILVLQFAKKISLGLRNCSHIYIKRVITRTRRASYYRTIIIVILSKSATKNLFLFFHLYLLFCFYANKNLERLTLLMSFPVKVAWCTCEFSA